MSKDMAELFLEHMPRLAMPRRIPGPEGFEIEGLSVVCKSCGADLSEVHGVAQAHARCTEFVIGAKCPQCRLITLSKVRIYGDHRILKRTIYGWEARHLIMDPWRVRLWKWFTGRR